MESIYLSQELKKYKEKAKNIFQKNKLIFCPLFNQKIILNANGFHYLSYSARKARNKKSRLLKFKLLPLAIKVIKNSGTLQEYRIVPIRVGRKLKDGFYKTKLAEFFGLEVIYSRDSKYNKGIKIRVILRKVGSSQIIFWSVMPSGNLDCQKLYKFNIEAE